MPRISGKAGQSTGGSWDPLPNGTYAQQIEDVQETVASTGTPQLRIDCVVLDGEYADRKIIHWMPTSEKAFWRVRQLAEAAIPDKVEIIETGEVDDNGKPIDDVNFDTDDLIGAQFLADARGGKDQNGNPKNNWMNFRPFNADEGADAPEEQAEEPPKATRQAAAAPARQAAAAPARQASAAPARQAAAAPATQRRRLQG